MIDNLKVSGFILFILFLSADQIQAQTIKEKILREDSAENLFGINKAEKLPLSQESFEKNELLNKNQSALEIKKDEVERNNYRFLRGDKEVNFELGYAPFKPTNFAGAQEYDTAGRRLGVLAFRWGRILGVKKGIAWQYMFETIPFIFLLKNEVKNPKFVSLMQTPSETPTRRETSYGFGITPGVIRMYFLPKSRVKPFLQFGGGIIFINKPMPVDQGSRLNFTGYFGGGILYQFSPKRGITLSYRYFHLSNGNTADANPGYNANTFAVGYSFFYK